MYCTVENIESLNQNTSHIYKQLTARWQKIQYDADIWLTELTVGHSKKRMANLLIYLASQNSDVSFYLPSREDMGALLAVTTETASRIIAEFKRQGLLKTNGNDATIDFLKLKQLH